MRFLRALPLLLALGCGGDREPETDLTTHRGVADALVVLMEDWADVIEGITDKESAEAARSKLTAIWRRKLAIDTAARKLPELPRDEKKRLEAETEAAIKPSWARIERNMARLESDAETWALVRSTMAEVADGR